MNIHVYRDLIHEHVADRVKNCKVHRKKLTPKHNDNLYLFLPACRELFDPLFSNTSHPPYEIVAMQTAKLPNHTTTCLVLVAASCPHCFIELAIATATATNKNCCLSACDSQLRL